MIDPMTRWAAYGEKPDYAGLPTYGGLPYTEDPAELEGVDAAIVGAPMDELTSDSPGTRFGPRAIRAASCAAGAHLEAGVDALRRDLRVVDFGDAPILPADPVRSHQAIQDTVAMVLAAGAIPIVLGGDHSIAEPDIRAVVADAIAHVGDGPVFLSVDIDVLDPAFAPGTGTPEPGGMTSADLLLACREIAAAVQLVGAEVVEVLPDRIGSRDITALVAERVVRETLTGVALSRMRSAARAVAAR